MGYRLNSYYFSHLHLLLILYTIPLRLGMTSVEIFTIRQPPLDQLIAILALFTVTAVAVNVSIST